MFLTLSCRFLLLAASQKAFHTCSFLISSQPTCCSIWPVSYHHIHTLDRWLMYKTCLAHHPVKNTANGRHEYNRNCFVGCNELCLIYEIAVKMHSWLSVAGQWQCLLLKEDMYSMCWWVPRALLRLNITVWELRRETWVSHAPLLIRLHLCRYSSLPGCCHLV